jgi:hypothetical protein
MRAARPKSLASDIRQIYVRYTSDLRQICSSAEISGFILKLLD